MKKNLFLISLLILSTQTLSNESIDETIDLDIEGVNIEEQMLFDQNQQDFVDSIKNKLNQTKLELSKYKTESEKNAAIVQKLGKKWNHEVYFGVEQEINSDKDWKFLDGSLATSPYVGMFLYQDGSKFLYDFQFLKTYIDHNEEYNRNRFSTGVTYRDSFKLDNGKTGTWGLRIGYRNDSYHWDSMKASTSTPEYSGYIRKEKKEMKFGLDQQLLLM